LFLCTVQFLMYRLESFLFLCTVHISDVTSGKCSASVHSTHFCCTVVNVFCFCAQHPCFNVLAGMCSLSVHSTLS